MTVVSLRDQCLRYIFNDTHTYISDLFDHIPIQIKDSNTAIQMLYIMHCTQMKSESKSIEIYENAMERDSTFVRIMNKKTKRIDREMHIDDYFRFLAQAQNDFTFGNRLSSGKRRSMNYDDVFIEFTEFVVGKRYFREIMSNDCLEIMKFVRKNISMEYIIQYLIEKDKHISLEMSSVDLLKELSFGLLLIYLKIPYTTRLLSLLCRRNLKCLHKILCCSYYALPLINIILYEQSLNHDEKIDDLLLLDTYFKHYVLRNSTTLSGDNIKQRSTDLLSEICEEIREKLKKTLLSPKKVKTRELEDLRCQYAQQFTGISLESNLAIGESIHRNYASLMNNFKFLCEKYLELQSYRHLENTMFTNCTYLHLKGVNLPIHFITEERFPVLKTLVLDTCSFDTLSPNTTVSTGTNSAAVNPKKEKTTKPQNSSSTVVKNTVKSNTTTTANAAEKNDGTVNFLRSNLSARDNDNNDFKEFYNIMRFEKSKDATNTNGLELGQNPVPTDKFLTTGDNQERETFSSNTGKDKKRKFISIQSITKENNEIEESEDSDTDVERKYENFENRKRARFSHFFPRSVRNLHLTNLSYLLDFTEFDVGQLEVLEMEHVNFKKDVKDTKRSFPQLISLSIDDPFFLYYIADCPKLINLRTGIVNHQITSFVETVCSHLTHFTFDQKEELGQNWGDLWAICKLLKTAHVHIGIISIPHGVSLAAQICFSTSRCKLDCKYNIANNFTAPVDYAQYCQHRPLVDICMKQK